MVSKKYELVMEECLLQNSKYIEDAIEDNGGLILAIAPRIPDLHHVNNIFNDVDRYLKEQDLEWAITKDTI